MFTYLRICKTVCVFLVLATSPLTAQVQSRLTGTVTDDTGAVIPGVQVVMTNIATGVSYTALSNDSGVYTFPSIPPAEYQLDCEFPGFKKFIQMGLVLETGLTKTLDIQLQVGQLTETVQVVGTAPLLESESSTVGQFIERATVANMPVNSRQAGQLVRLVGNIVYSGQVGGLYDLPTFSMAGGRARNQMWHLDGGVVQNMALGIAQLNLNPPVESLQEFKVEANNYAAEYGRSGNGLIIMTTRSGGNEFHGSLYEYHRNDVLDARTFFAKEKAPLRYNIFGGSFSGPIVRNKTFFFFNYEGQRRIDGRTFASNEVPHPGEINGDFSNRTDFVLKDPASGEPFPNNIIPASRIDPLAQAYAKFYPAPNTADNDITKAPKDNYIKNVGDKGISDFFTVRVDHDMGVTDRAYFRFSRVRAPTTRASIFPDEFADSRASDQSRSNLVVMGSWIHDFSPNLIHEVRYTFGRRLFITRARGTGSGINGEIGLQGVNPDFFPTINISGLTRLGVGNQERIQTPILTHQIVDSVTWVRGTHELRMGFEFRYSENKDDFNRSAGGRFSFNDRATGDAFAALLLGWVNSGELIDTDILDTRSDYWGLYFQDNWKVTPKFTLNLGLRWEVDTPRWEKNNRQSGFDLTTINPVSGTPGVVTFSGRDGLDKYAHGFDKNNFGPRVGFAWRAREGFVLRGGYGINYNGEYARAMPFTLFNGFSLSGSFRSPDGGFTPAFLFKDGMPVIQREELGPGFGAVPVGKKARLSPDFVQRNHVNGYAQQWNLTIQKELVQNLLLETAYIANMAHKLGGPNVNINMIPLLNGRGPTKQKQSLRPFPQFNNVFHESPPWGNSTYHSLNVKLERRFSEGFNFLMNYTWAKFMDDVESANELGGAQGNGYTHIQLRHLDKALAGNHVAHRLAVSGVWELPFGRGRRWDIANPVLNAIAGDWGMGVITEFRTGAPFGVLEKTNRSNTFSHGQRPNLLRDPTLSADRPRSEQVSEWFDTSAFEAPGKGVFGSGPRNICCGPGLAIVDLSVHKWWVFKEPYKLQFRTDFYNLPNRPNFANPQRVRGKGDFGRIRGIRSIARQIQFSLRFEF